MLRRVDVALRHQLTLANLSDRLGAMHGDRLMATEVLGDPGTKRVGSFSFERAAVQVEKWSAAVAARSVPGRPVVVATDNGVEQFLLCLAVSRAGGLPAPVNPQMTSAEVRHVIQDSGASLVIRDLSELSSGPGSRSRLEHPATPSPDDVAALFYTSGTTGSPKGAELTHRALVGGLASMAAWPAWLRHDEVVLSLPVAHIMGFVALLAPALAGVPVYFMPRFSAESVLDAIETRRSSAFMGVPATYRLLLEAGAEHRDLSSIRLWMTGADVMPADLARRFKSFGASVTLPLIGPVGEAAFFEGYGMVEVGGGVAAKVSPPLLPVGLGDSLGMPMPGWRFRVTDDDGVPVGSGSVGELQVKGPGVLKGYWGDPDATRDALTEDGWLRTGDLVRSGPFGMVVFQGRVKNVIKSGGYSVYAVEVEAGLEDHPDVLEAAVVGLAHPRLGEVPVAAVRRRPGSKLSSEELVTWSRQRMARYKAPRQVLFVDELPRTGTRKLQREKLRPLFEDSQAS
jgi:acyl-CoA synthetase (AMP-forming)/AMP-acid ligase II